MGDKLRLQSYTGQNTHVSVFLKRGGNMQLHVSVTFASCGNMKIQVYVISSRFRNGNVPKVVRFRCIRSNGNVSKRHETANGNTGYPSCFRIGFTCFCDVSVYGFLEFRPVVVI